MGEFGRTPTITATGGREHYLTCMSMLVAGGGLAHGQAIGSTDRTASEIKTGRVTPSDLGATVFRHLGIDLDAHWTDPAGGPTPSSRKAAGRSQGWAADHRGRSSPSAGSTARRNNRREMNQPNMWATSCDVNVL